MDSDLCYACNKLATTSEHSPPSCLFPENKYLPEGVSMRQGRLIKVRSCAEHNTEKSADDEYFRFVLAVNVMANPRGHGQALTKVLRSFQRRPAVKAGFLKNAKTVNIRESYGSKIHKADEVPIDFERFDRSLKLTSLGIYRDYYGNRFTGEVLTFADFVDLPGDSEFQELRLKIYDEASKEFSLISKLGDNPEVFWYQVLEKYHPQITLMRFGFYGSCTATALFVKPCMLG